MCIRDRSKTMDEKGSIKVTVPLTNKGTKIGKEVVQLYLGDPVCSVVRPLKEWKHLTKVEVEPDETVQVEFVITPDDLKFFDEASHRSVSYTHLDVYKRQTSWSSP